MDAGELTEDFLTTNCIICLGKNGPLNAKELSSKVTKKGINNLREAAKDWKDDVANRVLNIDATKEHFVKFHSSCRAAYTDFEKREKAKKRKLDQNKEDVIPIAAKRIPRQQTAKFEWKKHCFICGKGEDKKHKVYLMRVNIKPDAVRLKCLNAAEIREDDEVRQRLIYTTNLFAADASYHATCLQYYTSERTLQSIKKNREETLKSTQYKIAVKSVLDKYQEALTVNREIIFLPQICNEVREKLVEMNHEREEVKKLRSYYIKDIIKKLAGDSLFFHSHRGLPDIMCASSLTLHVLMKNIQNVDAEEINKKFSNDISEEEENLVLHRAATVLRSLIDRLEDNKFYPTAAEVLEESSQKYVPNQLQLFIHWLLDKKALMNAARIDDECSATIKRRCLAICESIIYSARRAGNYSITPPFHIGLLLFLHHETGSRTIIDALNAYGFCASYTEGRTFLTAAAEQQLELESNAYIPIGIIPAKDGGGLVQEGDDNIDINTQTIDGKNTYHSMTRVLFQEYDKDSIIAATTTMRIPRDAKRRTLTTNTNQFQILPYQKPKQKPPAPTFKNASIDLKDMLLSQHMEVKDLVWLFLRLAPRNFVLKNENNEQKIPFWTGFNTKLGEKSKTMTVTCYLPSIEAKPSDQATVYTTLKRGCDTANTIGQEQHIHTFDMQLYIIAQLVKNNKPDEFPNLILRLGGFHSACTYIACIGKIWGAGGLQDILVDSGLYARNTVTLMLEGKQFHRAIRGLTIMFEALSQLFIENFISWLQEINPNFCTELQNNIKKSYENFTSESASSTTQREITNELSTFIEDQLISMFDEFKSIGIKKSETFKYWSDCMNAIQLLLVYIRAEREGNWTMHLKSLCSMIPYFFVCDRHNYSRWTPLYILEMTKSLPENIKDEFMNGSFNIKFTTGVFRGLWSDMGVEMSVVRDSKSDSGIIGLTTRGTTVLRWTLTRYLLGTYSKSMKIRCGQGDSIDYAHEQESQSAVKRDEEDVVKVVNFIKSSSVDPYSLSPDCSHLQNIVTGLKAEKAIADSLLSARGTGKKQMLKFVAERLDEKIENKKSIHDNIKKSGLQTFDNMKITSKIRIGGKMKKTSISPEIVFQRALALAKSRPEIHLQTVLSHPVTAVPSSLFKEDGTKRTTPKSVLLHLLEAEVKNCISSEIPSDNNETYNKYYIIDMMAELQKIDINNTKTFEELVRNIYFKIIHLLRCCNEVHIIFDRYDNEEKSPKSLEHSKRYGRGGEKLYDVSASRPLPDWKLFMASNENKSNLNRFICETVEKLAKCCKFLENNPEKQIYLAGGYAARNVTKKVSAAGTIIENELSSNHTEADTRIVLHALYVAQANQDSKTIFVRSPDTDVLVLLASFYSEMPTNTFLWFETGVVTKISDQRRFIPVHEICKIVKKELLKVLPILHALTGCDVTSSFHLLGKTKMYAAAKKLQVSTLKKFNNLSTGQCSDAEISIAREFVSLLYDPKRTYSDKHHNLNLLRTTLATEKSYTGIEKLPPSEPAFVQHVRRTIWQAHTWMNAREKHIPTLNILNYGWEVIEEKLEFLMYEGPTSIELLQEYFCNCNKKNPCKSSETCKCSLSGLECCEVCTCNKVKCNNNCTDE